MYGLPADTPITADTRPLFGYTNPQQLSAVIQPGAKKFVQLQMYTESGPDGATELPAGTYDLYWGCSAVPVTDGAEQWGTLAPVGQTPTAEPSRLVLPGPVAAAPVTPAAPVEPVTPESSTTELCFDGLCLPPDVADAIGELWESYAP